MPLSEESCCGPGEACSRADCSGTPDALRRKGYASAQDRLYRQYPAARAIHEREDALRFGLEGDPKPTLKDMKKEYLEALMRPSSMIVQLPEENTKMDGATKAVIWLILFVLLMCGGLFGLGAWSFIELIQWITSK